MAVLCKTCNKCGQCIWSIINTPLPPQASDSITRNIFPFILLLLEQIGVNNMQEAPMFVTCFKKQKKTNMLCMCYYSNPRLNPCINKKHGATSDISPYLYSINC